MRTATPAKMHRLGSNEDAFMRGFFSVFMLGCTSSALRSYGVRKPVVPARRARLLGGNGLLSDFANVSADIAQAGRKLKAEQA